MTPFVNGAGSAFGDGMAAAAWAKMDLAVGDGERTLAATDGLAAAEGSTAFCSSVAGTGSACACAKSRFASDGLRSVIAATVRLVAAFSRFSASRLRIVASRDPLLRPPITTPIRCRLPRRMEVTRLKPDERV